MSRRELDETLEFIANIERTRSSEDVCKTVLKSVGAYGFEKVLAGTIPLPGSTKTQQQANVILHDWPLSWSDRYFSRGYLFVDPTIQQLTQDTTPFTWKEMNPKYRDQPRALQVMNEAREFRLNNGFTVPLVTLDGHVAGFSVAGEKIDVPPKAYGMLALLATYAIGHTLNLGLKRKSAEDAGINRREREILQWVAEGKSDWEVSEILNLSIHTVDKYLRSVRSKLNATNRTQAIAEAMRLNIIA